MRSTQAVNLLNPMHKKVLMKKITIWLMENKN